jgi:hypothetical protein
MKKSQLIRRSKIDQPLKLRMARRTNAKELHKRAFNRAGSASPVDANAHAAKMAAKQSRVLKTGFTPMESKAGNRFKIMAQAKGVPITFNHSARGRLKIDRSDPRINFNTGQPHTHAREIARHNRQQGI